MQTQVSARPLPSFYVGKDITAQRISNYRTHKHNLLSQALGKPETKCVWYSKEHLTKLLEEIDHAGGDGLRIHFGMYEDTHDFARQMCLLMTVTREKVVNGNILHENVVLENEPDFTERSVAERGDLLLPDDDSSPAVTKDFNYGSPCPPRCDEEEEDPQFP